MSLGFWNISSLKIRKQKIHQIIPWMLISTYFNFWLLQFLVISGTPRTHPSLNSSCHPPQVFTPRIYHLHPKELPRKSTFDIPRCNCNLSINNHLFFRQTTVVSPCFLLFIGPCDLTSPRSQLGSRDDAGFWCAHPVSPFLEASWNTSRSSRYLSDPATNQEKTSLFPRDWI